MTSQTLASRITCLYSIESRTDGAQVSLFGSPAGNLPGLPTMAPHFLKASAEMPWLIQAVEGLELGLPDDLHAGLRGSSDFSLFAVPDAGLVAVLSLHFSATVPGTVQLLDWLTFSKTSVTLGSRSLHELICDFAGPACRDGKFGIGQDLFHIIEPEGDIGAIGGDRPESRPDWPDELGLEIATQLIYKTQSSVRTRATALITPVDANRQIGQVVCAGLPGALLFGFGEEFRQGVLLSSVLAVAAFSHLRSVRRDTFLAIRQVESLQGGITSQNRADLSALRTTLSELSESLSNFDVSLASGVEAMLDIRVALPSPMLSSYHFAVVESMGMVSAVKYVSALVNRLRLSISAQRDAVTAAERRFDEVRRSEVSIAVGTLSVIAIVMGIFFGFFGSSAREVDHKYSFLSHHYIGFYLILFGLVFSMLALFASLRLRRRRT